MLNRLKSRYLNSNKGLTLVEVLLVIVIIAIIYAVFSSRIGNPTDKARLVGVKNDFRNFELALNTYEKWFSELPNHATAGDLTNLSQHSKLTIANSVVQATANTLGFAKEDEEIAGAGTIPHAITNKSDPWDRFYRYYYYKPATSTEATASGFIEGIVIVSPGPNKKEDFTANETPLVLAGESVEAVISYAAGKDVDGIQTEAGAGNPAYKAASVQPTTSGQDDIFLVLWLDLEGSMKMKTLGLDKDVN